MGSTANRGKTKPPADAAGAQNHTGSQEVDVSEAQRQVVANRILVQLRLAPDI